MFLDPNSKLAQRLNPILFLLPAISIYILFALYPTDSVIENAFTGRESIGPERNYIGLGLIIATMLARVWKTRLLIQTCIVLPVVISPLAVATTWRWMYQPKGMIPVMAVVLPHFQIVHVLGLLNTHLGVIFADFALALSVFVFMLTSYFAGVSNALLDAAWIDGATELQVCWRVFMPIVTSAVVTTALLEFLWGGNDLLLRLLLMTPDELRTLSVGLLSIQGTMTWDTTGLSAGTVNMAIPVVLLLLVFQRSFTRGMTARAVK